jgi:hypothetical protein
MVGAEAQAMPLLSTIIFEQDVIILAVLCIYFEKREREEQLKRWVATLVHYYYVH